MRGAVLHGLGMDLIKERLMRRCYGSEFQVVFDAAKHPEHLQISARIDGSYRCNVMKWYAKKGEIITNDAIKRFVCTFDYTVEDFKAGLPLHQPSRLYFCEEDSPPNFRDNSVSQLCEILVNHRDLPVRAFKKCKGPNGFYYKVVYQLELKFGSELVFKMVYQGKMYGSVRAHYV